MILSLIPATFTMTYNSNSGRFTINNNSNFIINAGSNCYILLGFNNNINYNSINNTFTFPKPCNLLGPVLIKIKSNVLQNNNIDSSCGGKNNTICTIPVNNSAGGLLLYNNFTNFKTIFPNNNLDYIDITITDEYDNLINFDGVDNFITLQIDTVREYIRNIGDLSDLLKYENLINIDEN
jgi:hypothetical protein